MNDTQGHGKQNPIAQLAKLLLKDMEGGRVGVDADADMAKRTEEDIWKVYSKKIEPLSTTQARRYLASEACAEDNALLHILKGMKICAGHSIFLCYSCQIGWTLLHKALSEDAKEDDEEKQKDETEEKQRERRERRLYCKLLLHHSHWLIGPAIAVMAHAYRWCGCLYREANKQQPLLTGRTTTYDMLTTLIMILMETRKQEATRHMAPLILHLHEFSYNVMLFRRKLKEDARMARRTTDEEVDYVRRIWLATPVLWSVLLHPCLQSA